MAANTQPSSSKPLSNQPITTRNDAMNSAEEIEKRRHQLVSTLGTMSTELNSLSSIVRSVETTTRTYLERQDKSMAQRLESNLKAFQSAAIEINKTFKLLEDANDDQKGIYTSAEGALNTVKLTLDKLSGDINTVTLSNGVTAQQTKTLIDAVSKQNEKIAQTNMTLATTAGDIKRLVEAEALKGVVRAPPSDRTIIEPLERVRTIVTDIRETVASSASIAELKNMLLQEKSKSDRVSSPLKTMLDSYHDTTRTDISTVRSEVAGLNELVAKTLSASQHIADHLVEQNQKLSDDNTHLTSKQTTLVDDYTRLVTKHSNTLEENRMLSSKHATTVEEYSKLIVKHASTVEDSAKIGIKHAIIMEEHSRLTNAISKLTDEFAALKSENASFRPELDKAHEDQHFAENLAKKHEQRIAEITASHLLERETVAARQQEWVTMRRKSELHESEARTRMSESDAENKTLRAIIAKLQEELIITKDGRDIPVTISDADLGIIDDSQQPLVTVETPDETPEKVDEEPVELPEIADATEVIRPSKVTTISETSARGGKRKTVTRKTVAASAHV